MMEEYKIINGGILECQKLLNQWKHEYKLEIYHKNKLLITHPYQVLTNLKKKTLITRRIRKNGTISYKGKWYTIDYKLAGKTVEVQETNQGRDLLVYLNDKLIQTLTL